MNKTFNTSIPRLIFILMIFTLTAVGARAAYYPGAVVVTPTAVYKPDGTQLSTTGTQTQGLQEGANYASAYGWDYYVTSGTYSLSTYLYFPPIQGKAVRMKNVTLNFGSGVTGACIWIDSCMMADFHVTGTINAPNSHDGILFRPTALVPLDGPQNGAYGCVDSRFHFSCAINTAAYKATFNMNTATTYNGNSIKPCVTDSDLAFNGLTSSNVRYSGGNFSASNVFEVPRTDDPIPFDLFNPDRVVVVPPEKFDDPGTVYAPGGAQISTSGTQTAGLQEAINYASSHNLDLYVFGRGVKNTSVTDTGGYYALSAGLVVPPMAFADYRIGSATLNSPIGSGNSLMIQGAYGCNFELCGQVVSTNGASCAVVLQTNGGNIQNSVFRIGHLAYSNTGAALVATGGYSICDNTFWFHEIVGTPWSSTGGVEGINVANVPVGSYFQRNYIRCIHDHGFASLGCRLGTDTTNASSISDNMLMIETNTDSCQNAILGVQVWGTGNSVYYKGWGSQQFGVKLEPGSTSNYVQYDSSNVDATVARVIDWGSGNSIVDSYWNSNPADNVLPVGCVSIARGAYGVTTQGVTLNTQATDKLCVVTQMRFSNDGANWGSWVPYALTSSWTLSAGDGTKTVYAQFMDFAGLVSSTASDTIVMDTTGPIGTVTINGGAAYTASQTVSLTLSASDALSSVSQMRLSANGSTWSNWQTYGTSASYALSSTEGVKTVYVQFKDASGNISGSYSDTITMDTTPPDGSIMINSGAAYTSSTSVTLNLLATDSASGVSQMCFSNDGNSYSAWQPYQTTTNWNLTSGDGIKLVYAKFIDGSGNVTTIYYNASIALGTPVKVSQAKNKTPNAFAILSGVVITAKFADCIYVEQPDRSAGMKVTSYPDLNIGDKIDLSGYMSLSSGEKSIDCATWFQTGSLQLGPLGVRCGNVGGSDWHYVSSTNAGQQGTYGSKGLNNTGLLVRICGAYTYVNSTTFTVNDGSGAVTCAVPTGVTIQPTWKFVSASGISSVYIDGTNLQPKLKVRMQGDIVPIQ